MGRLSSGGPRPLPGTLASRSPEEEISDAPTPYFNSFTEDRAPLLGVSDFQKPLVSHTASLGLGFANWIQDLLGLLKLQGAERRNTLEARYNRNL